MTGSTWLSDSLSGKKKGGVREYHTSFSIVKFSFLVVLLNVTNFNVGHESENRFSGDYNLWDFQRFSK